jgi:23S rRNA (uracil1939-C5)-methyltransferase
MTTLTVTRLGYRGDGLAQTPDGVVSVPLALPGEAVMRDPEASRFEIVGTPSPHRIAPHCPLFGTCGGCAIQHADAALVADWKREMVIAALSHAGIEAPVTRVIDAHGEGRRRVTFHLRRDESGWQAGFMRRGSHDLIRIPDCPILVPALRQSGALAERIAAHLGGLRKPVDIQITATATGLDMDIRGTGALSPRIEAALIEAAGHYDLARLSLHSRVLIERRAPIVAMGKAQASPAPGGFLQATALAENILAGLVLDTIAALKKPPKLVADLFAGVGPFALRLAERHAVHAIESEAAAVTALTRASRSTPGLKPVTAEVRDLYRRPLLEPELAAYGAVVLDPPRNGAQAQCERLAAGRVPLVAYVSCDPQSFARDAAILMRGGYRLDHITPVDQFRHAPHVELVGVFKRHP